MKRQKDRPLKDEIPRWVGAQYATREEWRNHTRHNEEMEPKQKQCPVVDVTADDRMISVHFQGKPFNITVIQAYAPTTNAKEAEVEQFYDDLQDLLELTPKKLCPFHHRGLECKSRKSRDTWSNRKVWPWSTNKAGQRLTEFCQEKALITANTLFQQHKRWLYTWTLPDDQYQIRLIIYLQLKMEKLYKSDWELTVTQIMNSLL